MTLVEESDDGLVDQPFEFNAMTNINQTQTLVICDDHNKAWGFILQATEAANTECFRLSTDLSLRQAWERFKHCDSIIIHWENQRAIGVFLEELRELEPQFDFTNRIIVVTVSPGREDVIYLSEFGVHKLVRLPANRVERSKAVASLTAFLKDSETAAQKDPNRLWLRLQRSIDLIAQSRKADDIQRMRATLAAFHDRNPKIEASARYYELLGRLDFCEDKLETAEELLKKAIELNPNFYRAYEALTEVYIAEKKFDLALTIVRKLQRHNKNNIGRMVTMGEIYTGMQDENKAEHYFKLALEKDQQNGPALNGLAKIRFQQGRLEDAKNLLAKSCMAAKLASFLNQEGITLVKAGKFEEALKHYSNAQYVLPLHDKCPMLFYNIGLCYSKWGRFQMAAKFLRLALIKSPTYEKASRLLSQVELRLEPDSNAAA